MSLIKNTQFKGYDLKEEQQELNMKTRNIVEHHPKSKLFFIYRAIAICRLTIETLKIIN